MVATIHTFTVGGSVTSRKGKTTAATETKSEYIVVYGIPKSAELIFPDHRKSN